MAVNKVILLGNVGKDPEVRYPQQGHGIETEYMSSSRFNFLQSSKFTGMFAAELLVKNAVIPLSFKHLKTRGYGFILNVIATIAGETISAIKSIAPTKTRIKVRSF